MMEFRCKECNNLLAKEEIREGNLEIKCPKCNTYNSLTIDTRYKGQYDKEEN